MSRASSPGGGEPRPFDGGAAGVAGAASAPGPGNGLADPPDAARRFDGRGATADGPDGRGAAAPLPRAAAGAVPTGRVAGAATTPGRQDGVRAGTPAPAAAGAAAAGAATTGAADADADVFQPTVEWQLPREELGDDPALTGEIAAARLTGGPPQVPRGARPAGHGPGRGALAPAAAVLAAATIGTLAISGAFGGDEPAPPLDTGIVPQQTASRVPEGQAAGVVEDLRAAAAAAARARADERRDARPADDPLDPPAAAAPSPSPSPAPDEDADDPAPGEDAPAAPAPGPSGGAPAPAPDEPAGGTTEVDPQPEPAPAPPAGGGDAGAADASDPAAPAPAP